MAIKSYAEMRKIDVKSFCEEREAKDDKGKPIKVLYLNWARCKELLHENGAEKVWFEPCTNANGSSLFMADEAFVDKNGIVNRCYEVRVKITIDDDVFEAQFPLMNGCNPVKDNSLTQQRLWNAQTRAFVKGVAMHTGLGFDLWLNDAESIPQEDDLSKHDIFKIKQRYQEVYTRLMIKGMSTSDIAKALNMTEDEVKVIFTYFEQLDRFEKKMKAL